MTDENGWTLKTLERYLSEKIDALEKAASDRAASDQRALLAALASMDKRLMEMNEFRSAWQDQRVEDEKSRARLEDNFLTKEVYHMAHQNLETLVQKSIERVTELDKKLFALSELKADKREGISTRYMNSAVVFAGLSFLVSLVSVAWGLLHR